MIENTTLKEILDTMDIPEMRRDFTVKTNRNWLLRNLGVRNKSHDEFTTAIELLRNLK